MVGPVYRSGVQSQPTVKEPQAHVSLTTEPLCHNKCKIFVSGRLGNHVGTIPHIGSWCSVNELLPSIDNREMKSIQTNTYFAQFYVVIELCLNLFDLKLTRLWHPLSFVSALRQLEI